MSLKIDAQTIPHLQQRYPTVGDWYYGKDGVTRVFRVSEMKNEDHEFLIMIHELIEQHLCERRGISAIVVDEFDAQYEKDRPEGDISEPGDDPHAPYYWEHQYASGIERMIAVELGVDWAAYCKAVEAL